MPMIVDYNKAKDQPVLEKGVYPAVQVKAEVKPSKTSEYPNMWITYQISQDADEKAAGTEHLKIYGSSPDTIVYLKRAMLAMGHVSEETFTDPKIAAKVDFEAMAIGANGLPCQLMLDISTYQGDRRNDVQKVIPVGVTA